MSCHEIEARIDELLAGTLGDDHRRRLEGHVDGCRRCAELVRAARAGRVAGVDLAPEVLRRTSGPACGRAERLLAERLDGALDPGDDELLSEHAHRCRPCTDLAAVLQANAASLRSLAEVPLDLTLAVLQRTSGPACEAAGLLLAGGVGDVSADDAELARAHATSCDRCGALAATLGEIAPALAGLAEVDPGPWFTASVLRRTTRRRPAGRLRRIWESILARPRFAYEAAYVGAVVLFLLFGTPLSPLREVSRSALALARTNPVQVAQAGLSPIPPLIADYGERAWEATGGRVVAGTRPVRQELSARIGAAWSVMSSFRGHARGLWSSFLEGDLEGMGARLEEMGRNLKTIWIRLMSAPETEVEGPEAEGGAS